MCVCGGLRCRTGHRGEETVLSENQIAQNFLDLAGASTMSKHASTEEALGRLVKQAFVPLDIVSIL